MTRLDQTVRIVAATLKNGHTAAADIPNLIKLVYEALPSVEVVATPMSRMEPEQASEAEIEGIETEVSQDASESESEEDFEERRKGKSFSEALHDSKQHLSSNA